MPGFERKLWARAEEAARDAVGGDPTIALIASTPGRVTVRATPRAGRSVAVKVYRDPGGLVREQSYTDLARDLGLPLAPMLHFEVGPPAVFVTEWVEGEPVDRCPGAAFGLGELLARYYASREPPAEAAAGWTQGVRARADADLRTLDHLGLLKGDNWRAAAREIDGLVAAITDRPQLLIHGDLQPEHVLVERGAGRVVAILDWADSGFADPLFEVARVSLLNPELEEPFLSGLGVSADGEMIRRYRVVWLVMAATWLAERGHADGADDLIGHLRAQLAQRRG